jgi:hypothetical protein
LIRPGVLGAAASQPVYDGRASRSCSHLVTRRHDLVRGSTVDIFLAEAGSGLQLGSSVQVLLRDMRIRADAQAGPTGTGPSYKRRVRAVAPFTFRRNTPRLQTIDSESATLGVMRTIVRPVISCLVAAATIPTWPCGNESCHACPRSVIPILSRTRSVTG